jgi:Calcineurin-like phosphoesterase
VQPRRAAIAPLVRLGLAVLVVGLGAIALLLGLVATTGGRPADEGSGSPSASQAAMAPSLRAEPTGSAVATAQPGPSSGATPAPSVSTATPSATPSATPPILIGAGDIARCDGTADERTAALIADRPGIVFTLGDSAYESGTAAELRDCYGPSWGSLLDRTRFAVAGNHDYITDAAAPFKAYFGHAAVRAGRTWFSDDLGAWHVVVLDANCDEVRGGCGPDSPQVRWLRDDLAASTARCTVAMWHQPRFSSGQHGDDEAVAPFWDALYAAGADLVLNGHDHDYERFAPQDPSGHVDTATGITEIVVGTGGAPLRDFASRSPNTVARSASAHGVLALTLEPSGWQFQFESTTGTFADQGTGTCH